MLIIKSSKRVRFAHRRLRLTVQLNGKDNPYKTRMESQRQLMDWVSQYPDLKIDNHENIRIDLLR